MKGDMDRREFVKRCVLAGAGMAALRPLLNTLPANAMSGGYDLCAVVGEERFENAIRAVDALGGMKKFVPRGSSVGILVNSPFDRPATFTNPDIALAVVKMCLDAGAKTIYAVNDIAGEYWRRGRHYDSVRLAVDRIVRVDGHTEVAIDKGKILKRAEVSSALLSSDVYINLPIIKSHEGTRYTCGLKNTMGACSRSTCRRMHFGDSSGILSLFKGYYSDVELLAQSIADLSLIRQPDLCLVDATEILATNGPAGPGEIRRPGEVIAATNCLAAEMYAVRHLGLRWEDLAVVRRAQEHGYGPRDLREVKIQVL